MEHFIAIVVAATAFATSVAVSSFVADPFDHHRVDHPLVLVADPYHLLVAFPLGHLDYSSVCYCHIIVAATRI